MRRLEMSDMQYSELDAVVREAARAAAVARKNAEETCGFADKTLEKRAAEDERLYTLLQAVRAAETY